MLCSTTSFNGAIAYFVRCDGENCLMRGGAKFLTTVSKAREAWNRRAEGGDDWQYKKSLMLLEEERYRDEKETLYGGPRRRMYKIKIGGMPVFVQDEVMSFLVKENGIKLPTKITCEDCAYSKREGNALRCPYSTVDLDPNGYCHRGVIESNGTRSD